MTTKKEKHHNFVWKLVFITDLTIISVFGFLSTLMITNNTIFNYDYFYYY